ncbi:MAG TPA: DUF1810 domain-containing protein [Paludibaculum sp.]|jgi:uncharacterized protein (DUF1810 family)
MTDPFHLQRFVDAQESIIPLVYEELQRGRKTTHWMWFVFPQLLGLGSSPMAKRFGIASRAEAEAYLGHPILGPRLRHCTELVIQVEGRSIEDIFGHPDDLKFRSSMTLFAQVAAETDIFARAIQKYFSGRYDPATLGRL